MGRSFFQKRACRLAQCLCPEAVRREADPGEVLGRWGGEDPGEGTRR